MDKLYALIKNNKTTSLKTPITAIHIAGTIAVIHIFHENLYFWYFFWYFSMYWIDYQIFACSWFKFDQWIKMHPKPSWQWQLWLLQDQIKNCKIVEVLLKYNFYCCVIWRSDISNHAGLAYPKSAYLGLVKCTRNAIYWDDCMAHPRILIGK